MPSASSRANSSAQPGSSTITGSPGRSRVRLTMSSAWVAPMVVTICSGAAGTLMPASLVDRLRRRLPSPAGSPYCSDSSCSALPPVDAAHRRRHEGRFQPVGRKDAHAGLRLVARAMEHAADQGAGIGRHQGAGARAGAEPALSGGGPAAGPESRT